jgi:ribosomal protein S18 acetylase RimI-like enzyme
VTVSIRAARADDVPALVQLRMANGERHAALDPAGHRVPEAAAVRRYFEELLSGASGAGIVVLVAETDGTVAGMTEVVIRSEPPPDHQILIPRTLAEVHTVVLAGFRDRGIGSSLVRAAENYAAEQGVSMLIAPILAPNTEAVSFYSRAGFGSHGVILSKRPTTDSDSSAAYSATECQGAPPKVS